MPPASTGSKPQSQNDPKAGAAKKLTPPSDPVLKQTSFTDYVKGVPVWVPWAIVGLLLLGIMVSCIGPVLLGGKVTLSPSQSTSTPTSRVIGLQKNGDVEGKLSPTAMPVMPTVTVSAPAALEIPEADNIVYYNGEASAMPDFRYAVKEPGESATFVLYFKKAVDGVIILRTWVDDTMPSGEYCAAGAGCVDLKEKLEMIIVPTDGSGTGNPKLDAAMAARNVNIAAGELLPQNKNAVNLGSVPAGSYIRITVKDDADKAVNVGLGMVLGTSFAPDEFTVNIK